MIKFSDGGRRAHHPGAPFVPHSAAPALAVHLTVILLCHKPFTAQSTLGKLLQAEGRERLTQPQIAADHMYTIILDITAEFSN